MSTNSVREPSGKVERVIKKYGLAGLGDELEGRWLGDYGERESLRSLADRFNKAVLEQALEEASESPLEGEVENMYRLLNSDTSSAGKQTEARRQLERYGVNVDELESDFVSHQAMHTYLRKHRGAELETQNQNRIKKETQTIRQLQGRTAAVTENGIKRLQNADDLSVGEFEVFTNIQVYCGDCNVQYDAVDLITQGGCDCED